ncbi:MAG TPA: ABC transporter permease subunit [Candidatus Limnocylindrales bacterium]
MLTRIRLTLKQHRFETIAITVVCLGLSAAALIEAFRLNSLNVPLSCFSTGYYYGPASMSITSPADAHCQELQNSFYNLQRSVNMNAVQLMLLLVPLLAGIVLGAPLVARELEHGTAPLSWALSGSRRRWLLGKVLAGVILLVPLMLALGLAAEVLEGALDPGVDTHAIFQNYLGRGFIVVFWALAAFAGTFALGTIFGRTMPALIVALVVCFFARVLWEPGMARIVLRPIAVEQASSGQLFGPAFGGPGMVIGIPVPTPSSEPSASPGPSASPATNGPNDATTPFVPPWVQADLYSYSQVFVDGKPYHGDTSKLSFGYGVDQNGNTFGFDANGNQVPIDPSQIPTWVDYAVPGSQYWPVVAFESGLLLLGSLLLAAVAFVWVDRRRPY